MIPRNCKIPKWIDHWSTISKLYPSQKASLTLGIVIALKFSCRLCSLILCAGNPVFRTYIVELIWRGTLCFLYLFIWCPNLMNLSRRRNLKPVSIERRLKSWKIECNFKWNPPFFKFSLGLYYTYTIEFLYRIVIYFLNMIFKICLKLKGFHDVLF